MSAFRIGNLSVEAGEKKSGELVVARRAHSTITSPVTVVRGKKEGPVLAVLAGEHGCEYCGIAGALKVCREVKPADISGTLVVVPVVNTISFDTRSLFVTPMDMVNIYTTYPGDSNGSITYAIAKSIFDNVVLKANYVVHMHGGDANEDLVPMAYFAVTGNKKVDKVSEAMARCFPLDYVFPMVERKVAVSLESAPKGTSYSTTVEGTIYREASIRGIPGTMSEIGGEGKVVAEVVDKQFQGVMNVLRYLGMMKGEPKVPKKARKIKNAVLVSGRKGGFFQPFAKIGDSVKRGEALAEILALNGEVVETIKSPVDGVVICRMNYAATDPNPLPSQPYLYYITEVE